ncbi:hypothetical protein ACQ4PT_038066 [Festuca glaucescens]
MGKKRSASTASAAASTTGSRATAAAPKKAASKAATAAAKDAQCDWTASTITKHDEKRMRSLGLISDDEEDVRFPGSDSRPNPPAGFTVMFFAFLYRGLSLPAHKFLRCLLFSYGIQLWQLTPNSILHLTVFITVCEAFLGIDPHWGMWKKIFFVKHHSGGSGPYITGGVGFIIRKEVNYFNFLMKEYVQGWRLKWFYLRDRPASGHRSGLPKFMDVLEATPKKSWQNILTAEEKVIADDLYEKVLDVKNAGGRTMIGTEITVVFLKRRIQPVMSRVHQMWSYSGSKDVTRINAAELSDKELLDEVRRLTYFSQEDSIPLVALQDPYELYHLPAEVPAIARYYPSAPKSGEEPEDDESIGNVEAHVEVVEYSEATESEEEEDKEESKIVSTEALTAKHQKALADELTDTVESSPSDRYDNDDDRVLFVGAAPEVSTAQPPKRPSGGFADEDELLFESRICSCSDEGEIAPSPLKKARTSSSKEATAEAEEPNLSKGAPVAPSPSRRAQTKGKDIPSTAAPPSSTPEGHATVAMVRDFASRFIQLKSENARLQKATQSSSDQLDQAVKLAAAARQEANKLKKELNQLKTKLKEEEKEKVEAQAQTQEKEDNLRKSIEALLGATDIPVNRIGKSPANSAPDAISFAVGSSELVQALLQKNRAALSRLFALIFPKVDQNKTLGQLADTFSVDTDGTIEVTPVVPFVESSLGSATETESSLVQQMRSKISRMEKDLLGIHAMAAVIKKKGELAIEAEQYALNDLQKATESLNFIALNLSEQNKRVHERVEALTDLSQPHGAFWTNKLKAAVVAKFQDRVQQVH